MWCALRVSSAGSRSAGTAVPSVRNATTSLRSSSTKPAAVSARAHASAAAARKGVEVRCPGALVAARMQRVPVMPQVPEEPRQRTDECRRDDERPTADDLAPAPEEPAERRERDDPHLRARPQATAEGQAEQHEI